MRNETEKYVEDVENHALNEDRTKKHEKMNMETVQIFTDLKTSIIMCFEFIKDGFKWFCEFPIIIDGFKYSF